MTGGSASLLKEEPVLLKEEPVLPEDEQHLEAATGNSLLASMGKLGRITCICCPSLNVKSMSFYRYCPRQPASSDSGRYPASGNASE